MNPIPLPNKFNEEKIDSHKSVFTIEPLYPGYGRTVGNALRRVLLSSLSGAAITAVKIEGVEHEFSTIPHVKEDVVDILLNIKQINIKVEQGSFGDEPIKLNLKAEGSKTITAGDFEKQSGVEILNPKHVIATLTDDTGKFEMVATVETGRGYDPIESREKRDMEIGLISVDAIYTPVIEVGYDVDNVRVGQMTNWDRVKFTIETKGIISPLDALKESAEILVNQFSAVQAFENTSEAEEEPVEETEEIEKSEIEDKDEVETEESAEEVKEVEETEKE